MKHSDSTTVRVLAGFGLMALILTGGPVEKSAWAGGLDPGRDILVFVDESGSTDRQFDVYRRALVERIVPGLKGGDRLRVAPITADNSLVSTFMAEGTLPASPVFDSLSDNEIDYKSDIDKDKNRNEMIRNGLLTTLKETLAKSGHSRYTDLFGAARMASQLFSADKRRPVLVFLSDMQEDRGRFRYRSMKWDKGDLSRVERAYGFPDLKGVCVYVIGTRSPSLEKTRKMSEFWMSYFRRAGADISRSHMGSMIVNWPPEPDCGRPRVAAPIVESWFERIRHNL